MDIVINKLIYYYYYYYYDLRFRKCLRNVIFYLKHLLYKFIYNNIYKKYSTKKQYTIIINKLLFTEILA